MNYTVATAKGQRDYQEDTYLVAELPQGHLFGCFDGHGGDEASQWMARNFKKQFEVREEIIDSLRIAFSKSAAMLKAYEAGTTASVVFIPTDSHVVYTAVIGDSPIIIETPSGRWYGPDHNVRTNEQEARDVVARGGRISNGYAMHGWEGLQMGRALGDAKLASILSTTPEVSHVTVADKGYVLIGTDGLFDPAHYDFKRAVDNVVNEISLGADAQRLVDYAVSAPTHDTHDNATAILVRF